MTPLDTLNAALEMFDGSPSALAAAIGGSVKRQHVEYWLAAGHVPPQHSPSIERATNGAVLCEALSADGVHWCRVKDKAWPWSPAGRPVLDVTREAPALTATP